MTELNALSVFAVVTESGSFSAAALVLGMPLSTVSRRVADLEAQLGVCLLERSSRIVGVTTVGTEILDQARRGRNIGRAVADTVAGRWDAIGGLLRLSSIRCIADALVAPLIVAFQRAHPDVRFQSTTSAH